MNFNERCYALLRKIPEGKITTYRSIAQALGSKGYRAVGNALHRNPYFPAVPCHRVVRSNGELGGFAFGPDKKSSLLKAEGIEVKDGKVINLERYLFDFA